MSPAETLFPILYEDARFLVINKPAGLVCHPTKGDVYSSLISRVRLHLGAASSAHLINRLDRETSGVVIVGKEDEAARELRQRWESRQVQKEYWAIVHGHPESEHEWIDAPLGRDPESQVAIKDRVDPAGAASQTEFWVQKRFERNGGRFAFLRVVPHTGRKHQIRIHLAHLGHPIVGDKLYGGDENLYLDFVKSRLTAEQRERLILTNQALHCHRVAFSWEEQPWEFAAEPEPEFSEFLG